MIKPAVPLVIRRASSANKTILPPRCRTSSMPPATVAADRHRAHRRPGVVCENPGRGLDQDPCRAFGHSRSAGTRGSQGLPQANWKSIALNFVIALPPSAGRAGITYCRPAGIPNGRLIVGQVKHGLSSRQLGESKIRRHCQKHPADLL